jgi:hypothetical protein
MNFPESIKELFLKTGIIHIRSPYSLIWDFSCISMNDNFDSRSFQCSSCGKYPTYIGVKTIGRRSHLIYTNNIFCDDHFSRYISAGIYDMVSIDDMKSEKFRDYVRLHCILNQ